MDITIPTIPIGVLTLLAFFGPYAVAILNGALRVVQKPWQRRLVAIAVAVVLAVAVLVLYIAITGDVPTAWPAWILLSIVVLSASYGLVTKSTAADVEHQIEQSRT